jgi:hypothetical protein
MGHGGSGHMWADRQLGLGRWFADVSQIAAVAFHGRHHGDRVAEPVDSRQHQNRMAAIGVDKVTDGMVDDWCATLNALGVVDGFDVGAASLEQFLFGALGDDPAAADQDQVVGDLLQLMEKV